MEQERANMQQVRVKVNIESCFHNGAYNGPYHHQEFSNQVERYLRCLVGDGHSVLSIQEARNLFMSGNEFCVPYEFEFLADASTAGW
jgi:hypothetical protein